MGSLPRFVLRQCRETISVVHVIEKNLWTARVVSDTPPFLHSCCEAHCSARVCKKFFNFSEGPCGIKALGKIPRVHLVSLEPNPHVGGINDLQQHKYWAVAKHPFGNPVF